MIAHGLVGVSLYSAACCWMPGGDRLPGHWVAIFSTAVLANLPDADMIAGLLLHQKHTVFHGQVTHTLAFALVAGVLVGVIASRWSGYNGLAGLSVVLIASHVAVDTVTGPQWGGHASYGTEFLWPVVDGRLSAPVTLFQGVQHSALFPGALYVAAWETVFLLPPTLVLVWAAERCRRNAGKATH